MAPTPCPAPKGSSGEGGHSCGKSHGLWTINTGLTTEQTVVLTLGLLLGPWAYHPNIYLSTISTN